MGSQRGLKNAVFPLTSDRTLGAADGGGFFTNEGATGPVSVTLPPAVGQGDIFSFTVVAPFPFSILANAGQVIRVGPVDLPSVTSDDPGSRAWFSANNRTAARDASAAIKP